MNWSEIFALSDIDPVKSLIDKYSSLFEDGDGKILNMKARIALREQAKPVFWKTRPMPYAVKKPLEEKLDHLEKQEIKKK